MNLFVSALTLTSAIEILISFPAFAKKEIPKDNSGKQSVKMSAVLAEPISVSQAKVVWDAEKGREYTVDVEPVDENTPYTELITVDKREEGFAYIIGLRENTEYWVNVTPVAKNDDEKPVTVKTLLKTETVNVLYEYPYENGTTCCFAGERASGLRAMPSSGAIAGSVKDPVTYTTIRRDEYGDYCCAMGLFYGGCGNRYLVELENGTQFTVKICDSKGWADDADTDSDGDGYADSEGDGVPDGRFHWFAYGAMKCVIEFIYNSDAELPPEVRSRGGWHGYIWNGLNLGANIRSVKLIDYGQPVNYE